VFEELNKRRAVLDEEEGDKVEKKERNSEGWELKRGR
jgi:hypothetical protein